jgi:hypothetical protein
MIIKKELAICRRRGHSVRAIADGWAQCKWCGLWLREVRTIEEREDSPPVEELDPLSKLEHRAAERLQQETGKQKKRTPKG